MGIEMPSPRQPWFPNHYALALPGSVMARGRRVSMACELRYRRTDGRRALQCAVRRVYYVYTRPVRVARSLATHATSSMQ